MDSSSRGSSKSTATCILFAVALFGFFYGRQIAASIYARKIGRENPGLYLVPQPIPPPEAATTIQTLSYFGFEFDVPWGKPEKELLWASSARIFFKSGVGLFLIDPATGSDYAAVMRQSRPQDSDKIEAIFGRKTLSSSYELLKKEYAITPNQIRPFGRVEETVGMSILLVLKSINIQNAKNQVYSFEYDNLRGFVLGDSATARVVTVDGFDSRDRHFELMFFAVEGASHRPTLTEIAGVLKSIRPSKQPPEKK